METELQNQKEELMLLLFFIEDETPVIAEPYLIRLPLTSATSATAGVFHPASLWVGFITRRG